jgi:hypothetical protein
MLENPAPDAIPVPGRPQPAPETLPEFPQIPKPEPPTSPFPAHPEPAPMPEPPTKPATGPHSRETRAS